MIDESPIVLWRDDLGRVRAMEDRCAHRRAALSGGTIVDGTIQCPYHGWRYDSDGACVQIPSLGTDARISEKFCVETYSVVLRYGWAWVWWGSSARQAMHPSYLTFRSSTLTAMRRAGG